jgi:hypothetical protein
MFIPATMISTQLQRNPLAGTPTKQKMQGIILIQEGLHP